MEWWETLGGLYSMLPEAPALAFDLTMEHLPDGISSVPVYLMNQSPTQFAVYPPGGGGEGA